MICDNYMLLMCKMYDIEYNNIKFHSRTFYTKSIPIASSNVFLGVDYVLFQCLFSSNVDLGFDACLAAGHRVPAHHHNVHSPLAGDLIAQSCVYEDDDDVHDIAAGEVDSGGQQQLLRVLLAGSRHGQSPWHS